MATRRSARRRGDRIAVLRPVAVPSGASALSLLPLLRDALAGGEAVLPIPADDARQTSLLTTALRASKPIDDDVAVVVSTSGTTGVPKGAMLPATALTASAEATHRRLGGTGRWLLALPAYHVAGLQVLVRSVVADTTPVVVAARVDGDELASAVASLGSVRRYASLVAAQLDKALRDPAAAAALACLDPVLIGGGPVTEGRAKRGSAGPVSVGPTYGMSEKGGGGWDQRGAPEWGTGA